MMKRTRGTKLIPLEKSQRTIQLDKRGRERSGHPVIGGIFAVLGIACLLYCAGIAIAGFGTYFFLIWGVLGAISLALGFLLRRGVRLKVIPRWIRIAFWSILCLGLLLFCAVEAAILSRYNAQADPGADVLVVLGAQWKDTGPSEVLRRRLDKAIGYLEQNPDTKVIVSGGQGENEAISEAVGMQGYLIQAGVDPERILVEDRSANTYENLVYSGELLDKENDRVVIVTNNFHVFRALSIAKKQGYAHAEGLAADSVLGMGPNNLLREFLGVLKDFLVGNL